jgi:hypothetical protein
MSNLKLKAGTFAQCSHCLHWFEAKDNPLKQVRENWLCRECCFLFDTSDDQALIKKILADDKATIKQLIEKVRNGSDESDNLIKQMLDNDKVTIKKLMEDNL